MSPLGSDYQPVKFSQWNFATKFRNDPAHPSSSVTHWQLSKWPKPGVCWHDGSHSYPSHLKHCLFVPVLHKAEQGPAEHRVMDQCPARANHLLKGRPDGTRQNLLLSIHQFCYRLWDNIGFAFKPCRLFRGAVFEVPSISSGNQFTWSLPNNYLSPTFWQLNCVATTTGCILSLPNFN